MNKFKNEISNCNLHHNKVVTLDYIDEGFDIPNYIKILPHIKYTYDWKLGDLVLDNDNKISYHSISFLSNYNKLKKINAGIDIRNINSSKNEDKLSKIRKDLSENNNELEILDIDYLSSQLKEFKLNTNENIIKHYQSKNKKEKYKYSSDSEEKVFKINLVFKRNFKDIDNVYYWKLSGIDILEKNKI